ncbi:MAG: hypothetical protein AAFU77_08245 [Myxococcota bacterium]
MGALAGRPELPRAPRLLESKGPSAVVGGSADAEFGISVSPDRATTFGPRGACLFGDDGPLWVCDTGHHRLLGWSRRPTSDRQPADWIIGQKDFESEGRNGHREADRQSVNVPTGIARCGQGMAVADAWNNRVLIWHRVPTDSHVPADVILGQRSAAGIEPNEGGEPTAHSMHWPFAVLEHGGKIFVGDSGNRRIVIWDAIPTDDYVPADRVLGQDGMTERSDNAGIGASASSMRWPHGLCVWNGDLVMSDAGNNRVLIWDGIPEQNNAPAREVIGQRDFQAVDHNQGSYWPRAHTLNMPYGATVLGNRLIVADTASSRLVGFEGPPRRNQEAFALSGQDDFGAKGDNRWQPAVRDSLCWPYNVSTCGNTVVIADSGNNRVLLWDIEA